MLLEIAAITGAVMTILGFLGWLFRFLWVRFIKPSTENSIVEAIDKYDEAQQPFRDELATNMGLVLDMSRELKTQFTLSDQKLDQISKRTDENRDHTIKIFERLDEQGQKVARLEGQNQRVVS